MSAPVDAGTDFTFKIAWKDKNGCLLYTSLQKRVKLLAGMLVLIFPLRKSIVQVSLWHGIEQHYNVFLQSVSFQDMHQRNRPSDKHILWHCKGHTGGIWNHASPCGNNSYLIARIDVYKRQLIDSPDENVRIRPAVLIAGDFFLIIENRNLGGH